MGLEINTSSNSPEYAPTCVPANPKFCTTCPSVVNNTIRRNHKAQAGIYSPVAAFRRVKFSRIADK